MCMKVDQFLNDIDNIVNLNLQFIEYFVGRNLVLLLLVDCVIQILIGCTFCEIGWIYEL